MPGAAINLKVPYLLSEEGTKIKFVQTGTWSDRHRVPVFFCPGLTSQVRESLLRTATYDKHDNALVLNLLVKLNPERYVIDVDSSGPYFDTTQPYVIANEQETELQTIEQCLDAAARLDEHNVKVRKMWDDQTAKMTRLLEDRRKLHPESEKTTWCITHGSERLRRAVEEGYACDKAYIEERVAYEYPGARLLASERGYTVAEYPSLMALDLVKKLSPHLNNARVNLYFRWERENPSKSNYKEVVVGETSFGAEIEYDVKSN